MIRSFRNIGGGATICEKRQLKERKFAHSDASRKMTQLFMTERWLLVRWLLALLCNNGLD